MRKRALVLAPLAGLLVAISGTAATAQTMPGDGDDDPVCRRCINVNEGGGVYKHYYFTFECSGVGDCNLCGGEGYDDCVGFDDRVDGECESPANCGNEVALLRRDLQNAINHGQHGAASRLTAESSGRMKYDPGQKAVVVTECAAQMRTYLVVVDSQLARRLEDAGSQATR